METLDLLIQKFKEVKEELSKGLPLHDTVEGFMGGLKALPKGSADRGVFITQHMNHGPFLNALASHPQGQQVHSMLMNHLNSPANAGFRAGKSKILAKSDGAIFDTASLDEIFDSLEKGRTDFGGDIWEGEVAPTTPAPKPRFKSSDLKIVGGKVVGPGITPAAPKPIAPSQPIAPAKFTKTINNSYAASPNMAMSQDEKLDLSKNGQWNIVKAEKIDLDPDLKPETTESGQSVIRAPDGGSYHIVPSQTMGTIQAHYMPPNLASGGKSLKLHPKNGFRSMTDANKIINNHYQTFFKKTETAEKGEACKTCKEVPCKC
jgi:hypothetical protein